MGKTNISWTQTDDGAPGKTWNPIRGTAGRWTCQRISPGCDNCYAAAMNKRFAGLDYVAVGAEPNDTYRLDLKALVEPLHWKRPTRIFVCSMTDLFGEWVDDYTIEKVFGIMALAQQHTFIVLTKRPQRMRKWFAETGDMETREDAVDRAAAHTGNVVWDSRGSNVENYRRMAGRLPTPEQLARRRVWPGWPLPNVWLCASVELDRYRWRISELAGCPAVVRGLSCEPLLGPVNLDRWLARRINGRPVLNWVIVGGESGRGYRPMQQDWARSIRDQCVAAGTPFFFKQSSALRPGTNDTLDGVQWHQFPAVGAIPDASTPMPTMPNGSE